MPVLLLIVGINFVGVGALIPVLPYAVIDTDDELEDERQPLPREPRRGDQVHGYWEHVDRM